jgi:hypothetical protein
VQGTWKAQEIKTADGRRLKAFPLGAGVWPWRRLEAEPAAGPEEFRWKKTLK